jgi:hypothetical protein
MFVDSMTALDSNNNLNVLVNRVGTETKAIIADITAKTENDRLEIVR